MIDFSEINKNHAVIGPFVYGMLSWSFMTMLDSIGTGETWRVAFAVTGFVIFSGLSFIYTRGIYHEISKQEH